MRRFPTLAPVVVALLVCTSLLVVVGASAAERRRVTVGALRDWPPRYVTDEDGDPSGFAIDAFEAMAERADLDVVYRSYERFPEMIADLERGAIDIIPNLGIIPERQGRMGFSVPVETFAIALFTRRASSEIHGLDDLKGRRVAVVEGNRAVSLLEGRSDIKLVVYPDVRTALHDLLAGRVDALCYPKPVIETMAIQIGVGDRVVMKGPPLDEVKRGVAVRLGDEVLFDRVDAAARDFVTSEDYAAVYGAWFAAPPPFWTVGRVLWATGGLLLLVAFGVAGWRRRIARDRRRVGDKLRETEDAHDRVTDRYQMVMDHASDGIFMCDEEGRYVDANDRACEMLGYAREELCQLTIQDVLAPGELERQALRLDDVLKGERPLTERTLARKDGSTLVVEVHATRLAEGLLLGIARDITERKRTEQLIEEQRELLRQAQKMEAVGRLAGSVAHDFNNVLTAISSYGEMLFDALPRGSEQREDAEAIIDATARGQRVTRQLLTFSRKQVVQRRIMTLDEVVGGSAKILERLVGEQVTFTTELGSKGLVSIDPGQIEQVVMNLVINARDAADGSGTVALSTADVELDAAQASRHGLEAGAFALLEVRDDGAGMDDETKLRIFEPFFTTKQLDQGTGLGLATVHAIVAQSGGVVDVQSTVGEGTVFRVYLPVAEGEPQTQDEVAERPSDAPIFTGVRPARILLVDDDVMIRRVLERTLGAAGHEVVAAASGEEALEVCEQSAAPFDLVVSDVVMPGMKGTELVDRLTRDRPDLRVIFISGYTDTHLSGEQLSSPNRTFLLKPFTPRQLLSTVRRLLGEAEDEKEPGDDDGAALNSP